MGKQPMKRKHSDSLTSSDDDEKGSKKRDATKDCQSAKRKQDVNSQGSCAEKRENCAFPTINGVSQSTHQIKKPLLAKKQATDHETRTENVSVPFHGGHCSSKAKHCISGTYYTARGNKTVERGSSKPFNTSNAVTQRKEETSKGKRHEKSSQRSSNTLEKQLMSPSLVSAEQKAHAHNVPSRRCRAERPQRTGKDSKTIKSREPSKTSYTCKDSVWQKRGEVAKQKHQQHLEDKLKARAKTPASTTKQPSASGKHTTSVSSSHTMKNVTSVPQNVKLESHKTAKSSSAQQQTCPVASPLPADFKIPKIVPPRPVGCAGDGSDAITATRNLKHESELSKTGPTISSSKLGSVRQAHGSSDAAHSVSPEGEDERSSLSGCLPDEPWCDQMQVVEELHLARSEKRLEVKVMQSYGELTCMDIVPPEEGAAGTQCEQPPRNHLILVLDTNILLSHLDYVKKLESHGLGAVGFPVVLIPWVVLQEMDSLKKNLSGSVAHLAVHAISYIYNSLKSRKPHIWGQSMQQAAKSRNGLNAENNDDRVLQCCLQYQSLYPDCALILCTNDKNLCSKALLSGVRAFSKNDLEAEFGKYRHGFENIKPHITPQVSSPVLSTNYTSVQPHRQESTGLSVGLGEKDDKQLSKWHSGCISQLQDCLQEVLSDVLEAEMKAAYDDLWLEIVYLKPPWTLRDVLLCLQKHWIAVFGQIVPRKKLQTVVNLIKFFNSGKTVDCSAIEEALQEAKELVKAFEKSSSRVPSALARMDNMFNKEEPQGEPPACDVVMSDYDDEEDKQPMSVQFSHQEVWTLFENMWSNVVQISGEVFRALGFDLVTRQSAQPVGGPPPPQDALVCLHNLSSMVSQLLQALSSVVSSAPGLQEVQALLGVFHSNAILNVDSRLTANDLLDCVSQQDYRDKLRVGWSKFVELKGMLDCCIETTGQHTAFPMLS
ncbi:transcriptional protein SWT1 isoform X2 [Chaetodon trifascialis]|uniref:transcriptional protein SWT1 isoform X2 n=1 Tax=Chaetodon trifascialis TaxID=109706 RepID=UPI003994CD09